MTEFLNIPVKFLMDQGASPPQEIEGFAFEVPGFPELHLVVHGTRNYMWRISHWESGRSVGRKDRVWAYTRNDAVKLCIEYVQKLGRKKIMEIIGPWI